MIRQASLENVYSKRGVAKIKSGKKKGKVAEMFDVPNNTVTNWWKRYSTEGNKGLKEKKRGRKSEDCKLLSDTQEVAIQKMHVATNAWPRRKIFANNNLIINPAAIIF